MAIVMNCGMVKLIFDPYPNYLSILWNDMYGTVYE